MVQKKKNEKDDNNNKVMMMAQKKEEERGKKREEASAPASLTSVTLALLGVGSMMRSMEKARGARLLVWAAAGLGGRSSSGVWAGGLSLCGLWAGGVLMSCGLDTGALCVGGEVEAPLRVPALSPAASLSSGASESLSSRACGATTTPVWAWG